MTFPRKKGLIVVTLVVALLLAFSASLVFADHNPGPLTAGALKGMVADTCTGRGINVAVITASSGPEKATTTTSNGGTYFGPAVLPGTYTVTASKSGYKRESARSVHIMVGHFTTLNFELTPKGGCP